MEIALLVLHYLTLVVLVIGYLQSMNPGHATPLMVWGARLQLLSGLILAGAASMGDDKVSPVFLAIKLLVMLAVLALTEMSAARARRGEGNPTLVHAAIGLVLLNVVLAYSLPR